MIDLVIEGGLVVDGTGAEPVRANVLVDGGVIVGLDVDGAVEARVRVDATGKLVTPGFVDIHTHSDLTRIHYPDAPTRVLQGITTEVIGNCGLSPAPLTASVEFRTIIGPIDAVPEITLDWDSTAGYLDKLDASPGATNLVPLLGHGSLRYAVTGLAPEPATATELASMVSLLDSALLEGYWGLSLGFMYAPGEMSDQAELDGLARVLHDHDRALLAVHMRAYDRNGLVDAISEVLGLAERADVPLEISHLRSINDDGSAIEAALAVLEATGVDVQADAYPYLAGHTTLLQLIPAEVRGLGVSTILERAGREPGWLASTLRSGRQFHPSAISIARAGETPAAEVGASLDELESDSEDWASVAERLLVTHSGKVDVIVVGSRAEDALRVLQHPLVSVGSDGMALSLSHAANQPHPRSIGTFPRAFRELSDAGASHAEIIHKMTGKPAARIGLADRGTIAPGMAADLVVLDPDEMHDRATYRDPLIAPAGIVHVWVAGTAVLVDGHPTGARPGRLLRRKS